MPLLSFPQGCISATLLGRHKRFLVQCETDSGQHVWAHTNNSGSMLGLVRPGNRVWLSPAANPNRKLAWTLELIAVRGVGWVGVNTMTPNRLLAAAFHAGRLPWAVGYTALRPETKRGQSRLDALLTGPGLPPLWVECKNVTLVEDDVAAFPDAVSVRAQKHVREMEALVASGERAAFFFCVQRPDGHCFAPAGYIDPVYTGLLLAAVSHGVECHAHRADLSPKGIGLADELPLAAQYGLATV